MRSIPPAAQPLPVWAAQDRARHAKCDAGRLHRPPSFEAVMFFFFSNRLGCLGSIVLSILGTLLVLWLMGVL